MNYRDRSAGTRRLLRCHASATGGDVVGVDKRKVPYLRTLGQTVRKIGTKPACSGRKVPHLRTPGQTVRKIGTFLLVARFQRPWLRTVRSGVRRYGHLRHENGVQVSTVAYSPAKCTQRWSLTARNRGLSVHDCVQFGGKPCRVRFCPGSRLMGPCTNFARGKPVVYKKRRKSYAARRPTDDSRA